VPDNIETEDVFANCRRSHNEIIERCNFTNDHLIDARIDPTRSLLHDNNPVPPSNPPEDRNEHECSVTERKTYSGMLKLISGALVGESEYTKIYAGLDNLHEQEPPTDPAPSDSNRKEPIIPSLSDIARKVALVEGKVLDEKQYITYEIVSCTFLLSLIRDGCDASTTLGKYLAQTLTGSNTVNTSNLVQQLKARGGQDQLLMYLTGAAGAGKSTAVKVRIVFVFRHTLRQISSV